MRRISDVEKVQKAHDVLAQFSAGTLIDDRIVVLEIAINGLKARKREFAKKRR